MMEQTSRQQQVATVIAASERLLQSPGSDDRLKSLKVRENAGPQIGWTIVSLPSWAADLVPKGETGLRVPQWDAAPASWEHYDWWRAAHSLLTSQYERAYEEKNGAIHSYSGKLGEEIQPFFDYAWVNRIVLFLRRWWAFQNKVEDADVFGPLPNPKIHLTHDIDYVSKTMSMRAKQFAFCAYNREFKKSLRFLFGRADYWQFEKIIVVEKKYNFRSCWHLYGGVGGWLRSPKEILLDPAYDVTSDRLSKHFRSLIDRGHLIGLHPQFDSYADAARITKEKERVESAVGAKITHVRQHWLRFSFLKTWIAQAKAGLSVDLTLGFNDRWGFRNAAALSFIDEASGMKVVPLVLMDSHLFDYNLMDESKRRLVIDGLLEELQVTGGEATVVWHQRVFHSDYGWGDSYAYLLERMSALGFECA